MKAMSNRCLLVIMLVSLTGCTREGAPESERGGPDVTDAAVEYANRVTASAPYYREDWFERYGIRLHYVEAGEGELVILYHGFPSFWFSFFDQMEALKSRYRVVAVDGLGSGLSDKPNDLSRYTVEALAAQLDALARHLAGDEKFILIGHDWGGALALSYAEAYPARLKGVVGMSAPSYNVFIDLYASDERQREASAYMLRIRDTSKEAVEANPPGERLWSQSYGHLLDTGELTDEEGELFRAALTSPDATNGGFNWYRANAPALDRSSGDHYWPNPPVPIKPPVLFITGSEEPVFISEYVDRMEVAAVDFTAVVLPGIRHWTSMQDPDKSTQAILGFLAGLEDDDKALPDNF